MDIAITKLRESFPEWSSEQNAWNERSSFFLELHEKQERRNQVTQFLAYLKENNLQPPVGGTAADIGCGVGDYALGLASEGVHVSGIDLSDGMIKGCHLLAKQHHLPVELYIGPWSEETRQELNWEKKFDLAYSIFCPVMFEPENIKALAKASRDKCLWIAFADRRDKIVDALTAHFYGADDYDWQGHVDAVLETVKKIDPQYHVDYRVVPETERFTLEKAAEYFTLRMHSDTWGPMDKMRAEITELLRPFQDAEGMVVNETQDTMAWVSWQVK